MAAVCMCMQAVISCGLPEPVVWRIVGQAMRKAGVTAAGNASTLCGTAEHVMWDWAGTSSFMPGNNRVSQQSLQYVFVLAWTHTAAVCRSWRMSSSSSTSSRVCTRNCRCAVAVRNTCCLLLNPCPRCTRESPKNLSDMLQCRGQYILLMMITLAIAASIAAADHCCTSPCPYHCNPATQLLQHQTTRSVWSDDALWVITTLKYRHRLHAHFPIPSAAVRAG